MKNSQNAYTLVELAVVIVLIGLIVAGILTGQTLIKRMQMHTLIKQIEEYKAATMAFKGKYDCLPGDCLEAYDNFTTDCSAVANDCNGNGNDIIEDAGGPNGNEIIRYWQHLKLADMIKTEAIGVGTPIEMGKAVPKTNFSGVGINIYSSNTSIPTSMRGKHYFMVGSTLTTGGTPTSHTNRPFLKTEDASALDNKIDDGKPQTGLFGQYDKSWSDTYLPGCLRGTAPNITYDVTVKTLACHAIFSAVTF